MNIVSTAPAPFEALVLDPDAALAELRSLFPGVVAWYGEHTGSWWAVVSQPAPLGRLIEHRTFQALRDELINRARATRGTAAIHRPARPAPRTTRAVPTVCAALTAPDIPRYTGPPHPTAAMSAPMPVPARTSGAHRLVAGVRRVFRGHLRTQRVGAAA